MQEKQLEQTAIIEQRKQSGQQQIHFAVKDSIRCLTTRDGISASLSLNYPATESIGSKKKHHALKLLFPSIYVKVNHCHVTPKILNAMCTGSLVGHKTFSASSFSPFWYRVSLHDSSVQET